MPRGTPPIILASTRQSRQHSRALVRGAGAREHSYFTREIPRTRTRALLAGRRVKREREKIPISRGPIPNGDAARRRRRRRHVTCRLRAYYRRGNGRFGRRLPWQRHGARRRIRSAIGADRWKGELMAGTLPQRAADVVKDLKFGGITFEGDRVSLARV